ncbi:MAG TPA: DUF445 domain-containing protein [Mycobacteriales bacterium]|nr:DUF445 domain-containing protein [Mycobacteriales bacterium]
MAIAAVPGPAAPVEDVRRLRAMKRIATMALVVAAAVFVATYAVSFGGRGFVRAAAEAAMVGGLADWFAITALFRRPLGLPIPHTALIPARKDALAESLGGFMTTTFLTRDNVGQRLDAADLVRKVATWLVDPGNASRVSQEVADAALAAAQALRPRELADILLAAARTDAARRGYAPLLGRLLQTTVKDDGHQALTDIGLRGTHRWLVENRPELVRQLKAFAEESGWLLWLFATTRRVDRLLGEVIATVGEAAENRGHPMRGLIDKFLMRTALELQGDEQLASRVNEEALRVLDDPALEQWLVDVVDGLVESLRSTLADPHAVPVQRLTRTLITHAARVLTDDALRRRLEDLLRRGVFHAVDHYSDEFTALVVTTVARWDGRETARRIEILAGRDLQFIRINGTVVGAIAGTAIHGVSLLL